MNVLIIRPGAIGDTLMVLPALLCLDKGTDVIFVGRRPGIDFIRDHVYGIYDMERSGWHRLFMIENSGGDLPVQGAELVITFLSDREGIIERNLKNFYPGAPVHVYPSIPLQGKTVHTAQYIAECLKGAGLRLDPQKVCEAASVSAILINEQCFQERDIIVVHPGSGSPKKNTPLEFWPGILDVIFSEAETRGLKVAILMGPAEDEIHTYLTGNMGSIRKNIIRNPDPKSLTEILGRAAVYIGHDSGITHLSALLGSPTIALFRSTDICQWRPLGPRVTLLSKRDTCDRLAKDIIASVGRFLDDEVCK